MKPMHAIAPITFLATSLAASLASAQAINLASGFMPDPQRYAGQSGGPVQASSVQSDCRGWISAQPSFILQTQTGFRFLRVFAESAQDTTLMIRGVSQTWCNDDTYGLNPGLDLRNLPPGRYDIYVGNYAQGTIAQFQLGLTELPHVTPGGGRGPRPSETNPGGSLGSLDPTSRPVGRPLNLPPVLRRPLTANGRTDGVLNIGVSVRGQGACRGWVQAAPSHVMLVRSSQDLTVSVLSAADTTLVMRHPDGSVFCNDDTNGLNPQLQNSFAPGLYQIWVGTYRPNENRPYRIIITPGGM